MGCVSRSRMVPLKSLCGDQIREMGRSLSVDSTLPALQVSLPSGLALCSNFRLRRRKTLQTQSKTGKKTKQCSGNRRDDPLCNTIILMDCKLHASAGMYQTQKSRGSERQVKTLVLQDI